MWTIYLLLALAPGRLTLAEAGRVSLPVVLAADATPAEQTAAGELVRVLRLAGLTVAEPAIATEGADAPAVQVGQTPAARRLGLVPEGPEAWRIAARDGSLYLTGGRPRGTLYAVMHFNEEVLGYRCYTPAVEKVTPQTGLSIAADLDRAGQPVFSYRDIYDQGRTPNLFAARNRINGDFSGLRANWGGRESYGPPHHVHTLFLLLPPEEHFAAHPEWYSEIDGVRKDGRTQLCLTNPEVFQQIVTRLRANIARTRQEAAAKGEEPPRIFSISQNDWGGACECVNCRAITEREGGEIGPVLQFVNDIADNIAADYPDVLIDTLAYHYTLLPPKHLKPRDNVVIRLCDLSGSDFAKPWSDPANEEFHDAILAWKKITRHLRIWDYAVTYGENAGLPVDSLWTMPDDYRYLAANGVEGLFIEHEYPVEADLRDLKLWVQQRLLEDPSRDLDALVQDFTEGFYGAAGPMIREYLAALHEAALARPSVIKGWTPTANYRYLTLPFLVQAEAIFDRAAAAVAGDPELVARVDHARLSIDRAVAMRWAILCQEHVAAGGDPKAMPLDLGGVIAPRIRATVAREAERRLTPERATALVERLGNEAEAAAESNPFAELPERFADVPRRDATALGAAGFRRWKNICKLVTDPEADTRIVSRLDLASPAVNEPERYQMLPDTPMPFGVYDTINKKGVVASSIAVADVPGPGYQWYTLKNVRLTTGCYFYLWWSWILQVDLDSAMGDTDAEAVDCDIHVQMKLSGPWFPHGLATDANTVDVQRIVVVRHPKP